MTTPIRDASWLRRSPPVRCRSSPSRGVENFHFYTMNRADLVFAISHLLGIRPNGAQKAA